MRIIVTGRHGQLARSLVERAAVAPDLVFVPLARPDVDLEAPEGWRATIAAAAPDAIVNAAAYTAVDRAEDEPGRAWTINAEAPSLLAAVAADLEIPMIQLSTDYVFDGRSAQPYREEDGTNALGVYGRSKLAGEEGVRAANPRHLILRTAWVYSAFGHNFVKTMIKLARSRDEVSVVSDQHGNPSCAGDLADGIITILRTWDAGTATGQGETYHLAGSGAASWSELALHVFEECRRVGLPAARVIPITTADWPTRAPRPANSMLDCAKFGRDFGFTMPDWRASVAATVERLAREPDADRSEGTAV